jgi:hypothetical protein
LAYLPFYITPSEFKEHQKEKEIEIKAGNNLIEWNAFNIEEPNRYIYHLFVLSVMVPALVFTYFVGFWSGGVGRTITSIFVIMFIYGIAHLTFSIDFHFKYSLSSKGLLLKKRRNMPQWINKAVQVAAWCAAIFCILMVGMAGPMILAGAGGAILLAFGMLKKQPDEPIEVKVEPIEHLICARYNKKRKLIKLYLKLDACEFGDASKTTVSRYHGGDSCYLFFSTTNQLEKLLDKFQNELMIPCEEIDDPKRLFTPKDAPTEFLEVPYRDSEFPVSEAQSLRNSKAPLPDLQYRQ